MHAFVSLKRSREGLPTARKIPAKKQVLPHTVAQILCQEIVFVLTTIGVSECHPFIFEW